LTTGGWRPIILDRLVKGNLAALLLCLYASRAVPEGAVEIDAVSEIANHVGDGRSARRESFEQFQSTPPVY